MMAQSKSVNFLNFLALILGCCAILLGVINFFHLFHRYDHVKLIIGAWSEMKRPQNTFNKVLVGINANVDLIVNGTKLMDILQITPGKLNDHKELSSLDDLQETFHYFFAKGSAAERNFNNEDIFQHITQSAQQLQETHRYIGGNGALMAQKISTAFPDTQVQLVGPVGPKLSTLLDSNIEVPSTSYHEEDEIHLIMEYGVGERWGTTVAPVATRFITSYDEANGKATSIENFFESVNKFSPDLVIFSGLHLLEVQARDIWDERLDTFNRHVASLPPSVPIHLELASMADADFVTLVVERVLTRVTSLGLNEQELSFISQTLSGPHSSLYSEVSQPPVYAITDILTWLLNKYSTNNGYALSRIHFHSLTFHIIANVPNTWSNARYAVAMGTMVAGTQACDTESLQSSLVELRLPEKFKLYSGDEERTLDPSNPVLSYTNEGYHFTFSPVLVCKTPLKTVGLGDAISATGLMYSSFKH